MVYMLALTAPISRACCSDIKPSIARHPSLAMLSFMLLLCLRLGVMDARAGLTARFVSAGAG
eukprot:2594747-Alexandrium_andersonii.AAC.1